MLRNYELEITPKGDYLHITVTGENTKENVAAYLDRILEECRARRCEKVLIEERLSGPRLGFPDVFEIASQGSMKAMGTIKSLAYVDVNALDDTMVFAETVAVNRALPVRVFSTVEEAEAWISKAPPGEELIH